MAWSEGEIRAFRLAVNDAGHYRVEAHTGNRGLWGEVWEPCGFRTAPGGFAFDGVGTGTTFTFLALESADKALDAAREWLRQRMALVAMDRTWRPVADPPA